MIHTQRPSAELSHRMHSFPNFIFLRSIVFRFEFIITQGDLKICLQWIGWVNLSPFLLLWPFPVVTPNLIYSYLFPCLKYCWVARFFLFLNFSHQVSSCCSLFAQVIFKINHGEEMNVALLLFIRVTISQKGS